LVRLNTSLDDCIFCEEQLVLQKLGSELEEFDQLHPNSSSSCTGFAVLPSDDRTTPGKMEQLQRDQMKPEN
jgi:hypothetical protein